MTFRPLQDRVLVRRIEEEEKSRGGIIIPDTAQEKPMEGEVIAAGPGARGEDGKLHPLDVKVGDRVLFGKWSGTEIKIDGEDLVDHEGKRHHGRRRQDRLRERDQWQQRKSDFTPTRAIGCCAASIFSPTRSR